MANKIYTFYDSEYEQYYKEAKEDAISAAQKMPALILFIKFIYKGINGQNPKIEEKTIDDAIDCIIDRDKVFIKTSDLPKEEKESEIRRIINKWEGFKADFKSKLKVLK